MSGTTISSTTSGNTAKVPTFAVKAGFVIPKNKLSGSLVPVLRGAKKPGTGDSFSGETTKHVPRKTKWGYDLTQDPAVRKGRALAYKTRVDQIARQLKSGTGEIGDANDLADEARFADHELSGHQIDSEKLEQLELEKREAIGEILKLNPSYKAPSDYKPLLKEDRVSIPVKQYPGYNFLGLIYGPGGDNQKHLEKETGAKIRIYGAKVENGQKLEIKPSVLNESYNSYEELSVHISADTFEKVDAAVSVIELLITSLSENLATAPANSTSIVANDAHISMGQESAIPETVQGSMMQPLPGPIHSTPQGQAQYTGQWFPTGPPNTAFRPSPGFIPPPNSSSAMPPNNTSHVLPLPFRPSNMHSLYTSPSGPTVGFNSPQNPSLVSPQTQPPAQVLQRPYMAQANLVSIGPPRNTSPMASQLPSVQANNVSAPSLGNTRPLMPSLPQPSAGFGNMSQMAPRVVPNHGIRSMVPQPSTTSIPLPSNMSTPTLTNPPRGSPGFPSVPPIQSGMQASLSGNMPNFASLQTPPLTAPNSGNFVFQSHGPQNQASQAIHRPNSNQFANLNATHTNSMMRPPNPQPLSLQFPTPNFTPQSLNHAFPRPLVGNNSAQAQPHNSTVPFSRNPTRNPGPSGHPTFPDGGSGPRNFSHVPNFPGPFPPRPGNHIPVQQFSNHRPFTNSSRPVSIPGEQLYDPFSPTSMPITPQHQGGVRRM